MEVTQRRQLQKHPKKRIIAQILIIIRRMWNDTCAVAETSWLLHWSVLSFSCVSCAIEWMHVYELYAGCCVCVCAMFWLIHFNFACQCEFFAGAHPFFWCPHVRSTTVVPLFSPFTSIQANFDFINVMKQPYRVKRNQACHVQQQRRRSCLGIFSRYIRRFAASHFLPLLFASFLSVSIWCGVCCASLANVNLHKWTRFKIRILCFNKYKYY